MIEGKSSPERREGMQPPEDKQASFGDWALAQRTRPNEVLEKIDARVDFGQAERRLEATYGELGRPGHRAAVMLQVMLLQHLYGLGDPQAEAQLGDRLSFQKFVGLRAKRWPKTWNATGPRAATARASSGCLPTSKSGSTTGACVTWGW
jgi:hypothetical protein